MNTYSGVVFFLLLNCPNISLQVRDAQHRSRLSNELMMYHILVPEEEVHQLVTLIGQGPAPAPRERFRPAFETFLGIPRAVADRDTPFVSSLLQ